ncbi:ABC transporter permease [Bifidobacterium sp. DSM 109960]|uniref:ABC transporter permease n=1 Tax=Bifidobacterium erythrocebi TaxID=2675325 RepID=A0A7Y0HUE9_9BIFI|nr:ABC transporter permease [Bifidobacterium sp. DSM 109960]NMM95568.1 ABC transporter permease [Bifidobacterium sp. DSM 109960]
MSDIVSIVRLRWAMQISALRKNPRALVSLVLGLLLGVAVIAIAGVLGWYAVGVADSEAFRSAMIMAGAFLILFALLVQIMSLGQGTTLSPSKFALYGISDGKLTVGLLAARLSGAPSIAIFVALSLMALSYRSAGPAAAVVGVVCAALTVITMFAMTSTLTALLSSVSVSKKGKNILYVVISVIVIAFSQLGSFLGDQFTSVMLQSKAALMVFAILAWTPFAATFQIPFDVIDGAWFAVAGRGAVLLATWVVCYLICTWHLRTERLASGTSGAKTKSGKRRIDMFRLMPDGVSGAVSARLALYLGKDARQVFPMTVPVLLVVLAAFRAPGLVWQALAIGPMFALVYEGNGLASDGRGLYMAAMSGISGWKERIGRARVYGVMITVYMLVLALVSFAITGYWKTSELVMHGLAFTVASVAVGLCCVGVAETVSCIMMYPMPPIDRPFSTPQGRGALQIVSPAIQIVVSAVCALPTLLLVLLLPNIGTPMALGVITLVSLIDGLVVLVVGSWLGGKLLDARMPKILATLDDFASLQQ